MSVDLIVGIPSRDEPETIGNVVRQVDLGLAALPGNPSSIIINVDNSLAPDTRSAFLATPTRFAKESHRPDPAAAGKGGNVFTILRLARLYGARAVCLLDADVRTLAPDWVARLAGPVLAGTADFVSPRYATSQGGPLRTLITRPVVEGLFLAAVDQPTGGEVAFTGDLAASLLPTAPSRAVLGYGVDIFLTTEAVQRRARLACADLGTKAHRLRPWHTITPIAREVVAAALEQLRRHRESLRHKLPDQLDEPDRRAAGTTAKPARRAVPTEESVALRRHFRDGLDRYATFYRRFLPAGLIPADSAPDQVSAEQWPAILFALIRYALDNPGQQDECAAALMPLFEGRMVSYAAESSAGPPDFARYRRDRLIALAA